MLNNKLHFRFAPRYILFPWEKTYCYLDQYTYLDLPKPVHRMIEDIAIPLDVLLTLFSPEIKVSELSQSNCMLDSPAGRYRCHLDHQELALREPMDALFHWKMMLTDTGALFAPEFFSMHSSPEPPQKVGDLRRLFWFAPLMRLIPYRLYVPHHAAEDSLPLLVMLHGGGSDPNEPISRSKGRILELAETQKFLLLCADCAVQNSSYGCTIPPQGMEANSRLFDNSPEILQGKQLSLQALEAIIELTVTSYGADRRRIYMAGNSMGGIGTFYFAMTHPGMLRAIAPAGAAPDITQFDATVLRNLPVFFTAGTEDYHGFCHLATAAHAFQAQNSSFVFHVINGGRHESAWVDNLDQWVGELLSCS